MPSTVANQIDFCWVFSFVIFHQWNWMKAKGASELVDTSIFHHTQVIFHAPIFYASQFHTNDLWMKENYYYWLYGLKYIFFSSEKFLSWTIKKCIISMHDSTEKDLNGQLVSVLKSAQGTQKWPQEQWAVETGWFHSLNSPLHNVLHNQQYNTPCVIINKID